MEDIDLDILRGWTERRDVELGDTHELPELARLVRPNASERVGRVEAIHGPDVLVGRHANQYGPVDLIPMGLEDHENYRLGAPHLQLTLSEDGAWFVRSVAPRAETTIDGERLSSTDEPRRIEHGAELCLGVVDYRFELCDVDLDAWKRRRAEVLDAADGPSLFIMVRGGPIRVHRRLDSSEACVVGRSFPGAGELFREAPWDGQSQPDWDLSGITQHLRKFVSFRHAEIRFREDEWWVRSLTRRQRTFLNRESIEGHTRLSSGDDIGLGSLLLLFHVPDDTDAAPRPLEPPAVVDWQEDSSPILDEHDDGEEA